MTRERIGFSFGKNWQKYLDQMPPEAAARMSAYVADWLGSDLTGRRVIDIGSGQGLTSLVLHESGALVTSIDVDPESVAATSRLWIAAGSPESWAITKRSILDDVTDLGSFDIVISWGVLHHTGDLWTALDNACRLVAPAGRLWIALYHKTYRSPRSLAIKRLYNRTPSPLQPIFRGGYVVPSILRAAMRRDFRKAQRYHEERGMSWRRDVEDWLGGLPYEVAGPGEVLEQLGPRGFELIRLKDALGEGGNDVYLFVRH